MSAKDTPKSAAALEERIDAALSSWPLVERADSAWEASAASIDARVAGGSDAADVEVATALLGAAASDRAVGARGAAEVRRDRPRGAAGQPA